MKIQFLRNENCPNWEIALMELKSALRKAGIKEEIEEITITAEEEAKRYKFSGSPTILINGADIDQSIDKEKYSAEICRTYLYKGKFFEYPPNAMIIDAIERAR